MDFRKYENKINYLDRDAFRAEQARLYEQFREDALKEVGLWGHPKADKAYSLAWTNGHAYGLEEVFMHLSDLATLFDERTV